MKLRADGIPRRCDITLDTPAETAIRAAIAAVEATIAHPRMTDAVALLQQAKDAVADAVESDEYNEAIAKLAVARLMKPNGLYDGQTRTDRESAIR